MHFVSVFNRDGGTLRTRDMEALCADARRIFAAHGHTLDCRQVRGKGVVRALEAAASSTGVEALLAGGGDGTVSAAAEVALRHGLPLAVLPAGTMNLFARSLQIPLPMNEALEALAAGEIRAVDIATANDRPFVHQFSVGIHSRLVQIRQGMSYRSRIGKMAASLRAIFSAILRPPQFEVEIRTAEGVRSYLASGVTISNNLLAEGHVPHADALDAGLLGVYIVEPMPTLALARLCFGLLVGNWKSSPNLSEQEAAEVTLRFIRHKSSAKAVIDGELIKLKPVVVLRMHPLALKVVTPPVAVAIA